MQHPGHHPRINIVQGEYHVSGDKALSITTLLGSCVAACIRDRVRVYVAKNFFALRYDYREEWLRLIAELSAQRVGQPVRQVVAQLVGQGAAVDRLHLRQPLLLVRPERAAVTGDHGLAQAIWQLRSHAGPGGPALGDVKAACLKFTSSDLAQQAFLAA